MTQTSAASRSSNTRMRFVIAGGTGFLGIPLAWSWAEEGHDVRILTRSLPPGRSQHEPGTGAPGITRVGWTPAANDAATDDRLVAALVAALEGADAVINLAGESIAGRRWTPARKDAIRDSRLRATRSIVDALALTRARPPTLVSGSGVGYYGDRGREALSEDAAPGSDFLARVCVEWEAEALRAAPLGIRVVLLRTGVVLERSGGALAKLIPIFRYGAGGRMGSGQQYMPWIHRLDWIEIVRFIVETRAIAGPVNATSPHPVTSATFARALGLALHRPALVPVPVFALRIAAGEIADALLASQRALPARPLAHGYHFRYPEIDMAFRGIFADA